MSKAGLNAELAGKVAELKALCCRRGCCKQTKNLESSQKSKTMQALCPEAWIIGPAFFFENWRSFWLVQKNKTNIAGLLSPSFDCPAVGPAILLCCLWKSRGGLGVGLVFRGSSGLVEGWFRVGSGLALRRWAAGLDWGQRLADWAGELPQSTLACCWGWKSEFGVRVEVGIRGWEGPILGFRIRDSGFGTKKAIRLGVGLGLVWGWFTLGF